MKRMVWIGIVVFLVVAACARPDDDLVETRRATYLPPTTVSPELSAIDSLMWCQPDSALACLIPYFDTCCRNVKFCVSTTTTFNRQYANLLLAELLYKNDYPQTNRPALRQAVTYFDSLTLTLNESPSPKRLIAGSSFLECGTLSLTRNDNIVFLDARAHYINGVGCYENDSIVPACAEYLKALELMENRFDEKDLVGKRAKFLTYTYNRLTELFSDQFMMETAILYGEKALQFCMREPVSPLGASCILYQIGKQYDELEKLDKARQYYDRAHESLTNMDNLVYRDIVASKALCEYDAGGGMEQSLEELRRVIILADTDEERLNRFLTMGGIFYKERVYDSAIKYLEPVFNGSNSITSKIQTADCLHVIYECLGNGAKADEFVRFLANHKKPEGEDKALVSKLGELSKIYLNQKQEKEAEKKREAAVKKVIEIFVPVAVALALAIITMVKVRSKKLLKKQREEADRKLGETEQQHEEELRQRQAEAERMLEDKEKRHQRELEERDKQLLETMEIERQAHRMEQAAISGRLKRKNEEVRELREQIKRQEELEALPKQVESFAEEPICRLIMERVKEGQFLSQMDCKIYKDYALDKDKLTALRNAADHHYNQFTMRICESYPELTRGDLDYCCLYLLGLSDADVAALMQRAYNTVNERNSKLRRIFNSEKAIGVTLQTIANSL